MQKTIPATQTDPACDTPEFVALKESILAELENDSDAVEKVITVNADVIQSHRFEYLNYTSNFHGYYEQMKRDNAAMKFGYDVLELIGRKLEEEAERQAEKGE